MSTYLRRLVLALALMILGGSLSGCIIEDGHWHHGHGYYSEGYGNGYGHWH